MSDDTSARTTAAAIETTCDHRWAVWLSDTDTWWAARTARLTAARVTAGCVPFLCADTPSELAAAIIDQDQAFSPHPPISQPVTPAQFAATASAPASIGSR
jgi:hypothetical protein